MNKRILLVDDEGLLLDTLRELLEEDYAVSTARGGEAALALIDRPDAFAVVVSDLHMPGMDGIALLSRVKALSPDTVRVILTGCGDLETAVSAVNRGQVFRFLTKPCPYEVLIQTLDACLEQHRLLRAERELLQRTLAGSVYVLAEILALVNPGAFGRATRIRRSMRHMAETLSLRDSWQYEVAGLLSQIGCVSISPEILHKNWAGERLSPEESRMLEEHPALGGELLARIPRLEAIAQMIAAQAKSTASLPGPSEDSTAKVDPAAVLLGGAMLRVALALDARLVQGVPLEKALEELGRQPNLHPPRLLRALQDLEPFGRNMVPRTVTVRQLETFMLLDEDLYTHNGLLIACRGHEVTAALIQRCRSFLIGVGVREPFRVLMPSDGNIRLAA